MDIKKINFYKISSITLLILVIFWFLMMISNNTSKKINKQLTESFAKVNSEIFLYAMQSIKEDDNQLLQKLIESFQAKYDRIKNISVIKDKYYFANSEKSLIGEMIPKEVFDIQQEIKNQYYENQSIEEKKSWEIKDSQEILTYTAPFILNNEFVGTIEIKVENSLANVKDKFSSTLVYIGLFLLFILLLINQFFPKLLAVLGTIIFILTIFFSTILISNSLNSKISEWNKNKEIITKENINILQQTGFDITAFSPSEDEKYEITLESLKSSGKAWGILISIIGGILMLCIGLGYAELFIKTLIEYRLAYAYTLPAMIGVFLLVFFPFAYGFLIGFTDYNINNFKEPILEYFSNFNVYGIGNFVKILSDFNIKDYHNFYYTFFHTTFWTIVNVTLHVTIGIILALLLNDMHLKGRFLYRILLILPWAVPSYITALVWKGMFHKQFGAINGLLNLLGFESISWFLRPVTAFLANLATNVWLGFPFMMVVALGALQSIPKELYEASEIDGANRWQTFWNVTFPLLKPAMIPSVILGTIWTFNQFNVIYLVSGGNPDGATEILITNAYRVAFEQYRYGYASAYSIIIFAILFVYGVFTSKVTKATKGVYE